MTRKHCFLLLAVFFLLPATGFACSCGTGDPPFEYNRAKAIFIGKMLGGTFYGLPILTPGMFLHREREAGRLPESR